MCPGGKSHPSAEAAEQRLDDTRWGILPYLNLAYSLTKGTQVHPGLRLRGTRNPGNVGLYFSLAIASFLLKLRAPRQADKPRFISSH